MEMTSERTVRNAEMAIAQRKLMIARQWSGLRERSVDAVARPTTLGALALAGAVAGWRSAGKNRNRAKNRVNGQARQPQGESSSSILDGALRSVSVGMLRAFATMAIEEFLRGDSRKAARSSPGGAGLAGGRDGNVRDSTPQ